MRAAQPLAWQNHVHTRTLAGRPTRILDVGSGPVIVCASGIASTLWDWLLLADELRSSCRVIAFDRPGYAPGDDVPQAAPALAGEAERLLAVLNACGVTEPVTAVGHSFGAAVVEAAARLHPDRVARLVLLDGSVPQESVPQDEAAADHGAQTGRRRTRAALTSRPARTIWRLAGPITALAAAPGRRRLLSLVPGWVREMGAVSVAVATVRELLAYEPVMNELVRLRAATLLPSTMQILVVTANGRLPRPSLTRWVRTVLGQADALQRECPVTTVVMPRSGHFVMLDQPARTAKLVDAAARA